MVNWYFDDLLGHKLPRGEKMGFLMYFKDGNVPDKVLHFFDGACPYCQESVRRGSTCPKNGCRDGNIEKLSRKVRIKRLVSGQSTQ